MVEPRLFVVRADAPRRPPRRLALAFALCLAQRKLGRQAHKQTGPKPIETRVKTEQLLIVCVFPTKREEAATPSTLSLFLSDFQSNALPTLRCSHTKSTTSACSGSASNCCKPSVGGPGVRTSSSFVGLGALGAAALPPLPEPCDDAALVLLAWLWPRDSKKSPSTLPLLFFFFFGGALFLVCDARFDPA